MSGQASLNDFGLAARVRQVAQKVREAAREQEVTLHAP